MHYRNRTDDVPGLPHAGGTPATDSLSADSLPTTRGDTRATTTPSTTSIVNFTIEISPNGTQLAATPKGPETGTGRGSPTLVSTLLPHLALRRALHAAELHPRDLVLDPHIQVSHAILASHDHHVDLVLPSYTTQHTCHHGDVRRAVTLGLPLVIPQDVPSLRSTSGHALLHRSGLVRVLGHARPHPRLPRVTAKTLPRHARRTMTHIPPVTTLSLFQDSLQPGSLLPYPRMQTGWR